MEKIYKLIIIGGGIAGIATAIHAKPFLSDVLLIEKKIIGGKINEISLIDNYSEISQIAGKKLVLMMKKQLLKINLLVKKLEITSLQKESNLFVVKGKNYNFYSHSVVIATGSSYKKLKLEKIKNIHYKSFSYRAVKDAYLIKNKAIAVIGGGYSGCQTANFLSDFAKKVYLVHKGKELNVDLKLKNKILENDKIEIYLNSSILQTNGEKKLESCTIFVNDNFQKELAVMMVFPCIGTVANSWFVRETIDCTDVGNIKVSDNFQTNIKGLFAIGDVILKNISQIAMTIEEGKQAAQSVINYLSNLSENNL